MSPPLVGSIVMDNLCDALARGRLCLAELILLDPPELEAMYEIGIGRIETGRIDEAITIHQALVALYAYSAMYWRALGLALHLGGRLEAAMLAYQLALHLDPDHLLTVCYLGELKLFCGMPEEAYPLLERVARSQHPQASKRALQLIGMPMAPPLPDVPPITYIQAREITTDTFELADGSPLPMPRPDTDTQIQAFPQVREVTNKIFLADHAETPGHITETAIVHHPSRPARPLGMSHEGSATDTGVVDRAGDADDEAQPGDARWDFLRWFASAARRRRKAAPLLDDDETTPMGPKRGTR